MLQQTFQETDAPSTPGEGTPAGLDRIPEPGPSADPDALLVEALKGRNAAAFDDLVKQFGRRLLNLAMKITKNRGRC